MGGRDISNIMYEDNHYFATHDPTIGGVGCGGEGSYHGSSLIGGATSRTNSLDDNMKLPTFSLDDLSNHQHPSDEAVVATGFELEHEFNTHLMHDMLHDPNSVQMPPMLDQQNWETGVQEMQNMSAQQAQQYHELQQNFQCYNSAQFSTNSQFGPTPTPDLLNLLQLPRCSVASMLPNSSISFANQRNSLDIFGELPIADNGSASSTVLYDPPLHLNLPPQPPIFRELFQSLPHTYNLPNSRGGAGSSLFGGVDEREAGGGGGDGVYQDGEGRQFLDFSREVRGLGKGGEGKGGKHFTTERQRREQLNEKFTALRQLIPNPTKPDRATIVGEATDYIKELQRTVDELKILVDKKRCGSDRCKRLKMEDEAVGDMESSSMKPFDREHSNSKIRCSWLQRKTKDTEVDVRIIENEVTVKLIQRKKMNCLLNVSKVLDELQLDLLHVSGGNIGINYSFLFNTKIYEGSSVYASAIAKKLIEAVDKNYAAFPPAGF